jgi:hypothetical protein
MSCEAPDLGGRFSAFREKAVEYVNRKVPTYRVYAMQIEAPPQRFKVKLPDTPGGQGGMIGGRQHDWLIWNAELGYRVVREIDFGVEWAKA